MSDPIGDGLDDPGSLTPTHRDPDVGLETQVRALAAVRDVGNSIVQGLAIIRSFIRDGVATEDMNARAQAEVQQLQMQYGRQTSEIMGAAAMARARQLIMEGRTRDAALMLQRLQAAEANKPPPPPDTTTADVAVFVVGLVALAGGGYYYWRQRAKPPRAPRR